MKVIDHHTCLNIIMNKISKVKLFINNNLKSRKAAEEIKKELINNKFQLVEEDFDLGIAVGGDGSFLRMVTNSNFNSECYYVGINAGTLGFAQDISLEEIKPFIKSLSKENINYDKIGIGEVEVIFKNKTINKFNIVNEIVIRNEELNTLHANVFVDESLLEKYVGDGLLIATSFGSTAYNLSFGGSIVFNTFDTLQLTPIAPLNNKSYRNLINSVIIPSNKIITIEPNTNDNNLLITVDGKNTFLNEVEKIKIVINNKTINIIRKKDYDFIKKVNEKFIK